MSFCDRGIVEKLRLKYCAKRPSAVPEIANAGPSSTTSGARESPLSERMAWFSCAELPSGLSFVIGIPYFFENVDMISP